jgi:D-arabinose 1-dehydrogenase-like Zn-dependent alcohol dehydrogenase
MYKALKRCDLKPGETVGIIGCGGGLGTTFHCTDIGHLGLQFAVRMGYKVIGVDNNDQPLAVAKSLNCADLILDARITPAIIAEQKISTLTAHMNHGHGGCAATIILPESQAAFTYAAKITRKHGVLMTVSVPTNGWHIDSDDLIFKDLRVRGSLYASVGDAVDMLREIEGDMVKVVKRVFPFERINEAIEDSKSGGKIVVEFVKEG